MNTGKKSYFPIYMDFSDKEFLAVGSGRELTEAVGRLAGFAGDLRVITQEPSPDLLRMEEEGKLRILQKAYEREDLYGADYVIARTGDPETDQDIYAACKCLGIAVHIFGDPGRCDFFFDQVPQEKSPLMHVRIYTDGAARGNPDGPGGYGTVLEFEDAQGNLHTRELSEGYVRTTNNRMELMAAIAGLEALKKPCIVELYSDSKYLTDAFNQHWIEGWIKKGWKRSGNEPVKNLSLWKRLLKAAKPHEVTYIWVKGHNGHPQNERCDQLATSAADSGNLIEDDLGE